MIRDLTPNWAKPFVDMSEAVIHESNDGKFAIVEHNLQTTLFVGDTLEEVRRAFPNVPTSNYHEVCAGCSNYNSA